MNPVHPITPIDAVIDTTTTQIIQRILAKSKDHATQWEILHAMHIDKIDHVFSTHLNPHQGYEAIVDSLALITHIFHRAHVELKALQKRNIH